MLVKPVIDPPYTDPYLENDIDYALAIFMPTLKDGNPEKTEVVLKVGAF